MALAFAATLAATPLYAQIVNDGATNTLANVTNTITGTVTVGTNGSFTLLTLANNALLTNSANGVIGRSATAKSNAVHLLSASARWQMGASLFVGSNGSFNRLVVSNGAFLKNNDSFIGIGAAASNNEVMVTGAGSFWTNRSHLYLGEFGSSGNRLVISNGALVGNGAGFIGFAPSSSNNSVLVTGGGSTWSNRSAVQVGQSGNGNLLAISNGGRVISAGGNLGAFSANNLAVVTGPGSTWSNLTDLAVGVNGAGNSLVVSNGGLVSANDNIYVGATATSTNNRVIVDGGTLRVTNAAVTGVLDVRRGTNQLVSGLIETDRLLLTNTMGGFEFRGGTLVTRGATIYNASSPFVVGSAGSTPAVWDVRAGPASHFLTHDLQVGENSSFNQLFITNGAALNSSYGSLGYSAIAASNVVLVSGVGSAWTNSAVFVGVNGSGNQLIVSNGGVMQSTGISLGSTIGAFSSGSSNNSVIVTGAGSVWDCRLGLDIAGSTGNRLIVANGGTVTVREFSFSILRLGYGTATNSLVHVDGGSLTITNVVGDGALVIFNGTNQLDAGLMAIDIVQVTDSKSQFEFNGGILKTRAVMNNNGRTFVVGDGTHDATLQLRSGSSSFPNSLLIATNASLTGNGVVTGTVVVAVGGNLAPGVSIGGFNLFGTAVLQGASNFEIQKNGGVRTNDYLTASTIIYGGTLNVTNIGSSSLTAGDRFDLFNGALIGTFASLNLPPLNPGLDWTNKLLVDGSIEVVGAPKFISIAASGTNVIIAGTNGTTGGNFAILTATNIVTPLSNWVSIATNPFNSGGGFSFSNAIAPGESQRYFRLRTP